MIDKTILKLQGKLMFIQTKINDHLNNMQEDPFYAIPGFSLELIWNELDQVISALAAYEEA